MRKFGFVPPLIALAAGAAGMMLRKKELSTVFDPVSGLAEKGAPVTVMLIALSVMVSVAALIYAFIYVKKMPEYTIKGYSGNNATAFKRNAVSVVLSAAAGAVMVGAAFMMYRDAYPVNHTLVKKIFAGMAVVTGICVTGAAIAGNDSPITVFMNLVPELLFAFWLAINYKLNGRCPVITSFCYECFAYASAAVAYFNHAGFAFKRGKPFWTAAFSLMAVFFIIVSLADSRPVSATVFMGAALLDMLVRACCFISGGEENKEKAE